jgi:hypothetical protein
MCATCSAHHIGCDLIIVIMSGPCLLSFYERCVRIAFKFHFRLTCLAELDIDLAHRKVTKCGFTLSASVISVGSCEDLSGFTVPRRQLSVICAENILAWKQQGDGENTILKSTVCNLRLILLR